MNARTRRCDPGDDQVQVVVVCQKIEEFYLTDLSHLFLFRNIYEALNDDETQQDETSTTLHVLVQTEEDHESENE